MKEYEKKIKKEQSFIAKIFKFFIALITIAALTYFLIYKEYLKIGSMKQQSIQFEQIYCLTYPMTSEILPVHQFSDFNKEEINDRMECFINLKP